MIQWKSSIGRCNCRVILVDATLQIAQMCDVISPRFGPRIGADIEDRSDPLDAGFA
jgi:hypothetical protein